jgi:hypothetical protein
VHLPARPKVTAPQVIITDPGTSTAPTGPDASASTGSEPSPGQDAPAGATGQGLGGPVGNPPFPGFQGTAIRELGLAVLRIPWQKLAKVIVLRLRVSKVP